MNRAFRVSTAIVAAAMMTLPVAALASVAHPRVVSEDPADFTPRLVDTLAIQEHVNAVAQLGGTMYAGGRFDTVTDGTANLPRVNFMMFDRTTGAVAASPDFNSEAGRSSPLGIRCTSGANSALWAGSAGRAWSS